MVFAFLDSVLSVVSSSFGLERTVGEDVGSRKAPMVNKEQLMEERVYCHVA